MKTRRIIEILTDLKKEIEKEMISATLTLEEDDTAVFVAWTTEVDKEYEYATVDICGLSEEPIKDKIRKLCLKRQ